MIALAFALTAAHLAAAHLAALLVPVLAAANPIQSIVDTFTPWIKSAGGGIGLYGLISAGGKAARHRPDAGESFLMWLAGAIGIFFAPEIIDIISKIKVA